MVGSLESIDSATIVVRRENGDAIAFHRFRDTRFEVSDGPGACSDGRRGNCVAIGFFGGAALGAFVGFLASRGSGCSDEPCELAYLFTVPGGALLGTIIGASVGGDHWRSVSLPAHLALGPGRSGGFTLGLSIPF